MKKIVLIICMGLILFTVPVQAEPVTLITQGDTWNYAVLTIDLWDSPNNVWAPVTYSSFDWENATWLTGQAAFGNPTISPPPPGYDPGLPYNTLWSDNTDLALTKTVMINGIFTGSLTLHAAVDNGFILFVNETEVFRDNRGLYTVYWEYTIPIDPSVFSQGLNTISVFAEDHGGATFFDMELIGDLQYVPGPIDIDIKPGTENNSINPKSRGKIPVAILSTEDFDAPSQVDQYSLTFGRTGDEVSLAFCNPKGEDINGDGLKDLVCHFRTEDTGLECGDTEGVLKGLTMDGTPVEGKDSVRIVPCKK